MGFIAKKDINKISEVFIYRTIDNFKDAEDIAKAVLQLSYNKNLL